MRTFFKNRIPGVIAFSVVCIFLFGVYAYAQMKKVTYSLPPVTQTEETFGASGQFEPYNVTWNADKVAEDKTEIHIKWTNYVDEGGAWADIDTTVRDTGSKFVMDKAPFTFEAPKRSTGIAKFISTVRYDHVLEQTISEPPVTMQLSAEGVVDVPGELFDMNGDGIMDSVLYPQAYPSQDADLIYYVHHGEQPVLQKLVRYNSKPTVIENRSFLVETDRSLRVEVPRIPTNAEKRDAADSIRRAQARLDAVKGDAAESAQRFREVKRTMRASELIKTRKLGNNEVLVEDLKGQFAWKDGTATSSRGFGWRDPLIWDSTPGQERKWREVPVTLERVSGNLFKLTKNLSDVAAFFDTASYPVYTDTTTTVFPAAGTGTNGMDGDINYNPSSSDWATVHDGTNGSAAFPSAADIYTYSRLTAGGLYIINRTHTGFDTSAIPDTDTISAATIDFYIDAITNEDNDGDDWINIVQSTPASNSDLVTEDYDQIGAVSNPTEGATRIDIGSLTATQDNTWTFNATGLTFISKTGITNIGWREGHDALNSAIVGGGGARNQIQWRSADTAGTTDDPTLTITHAAAAAVGGGGQESSFSEIID